MYFNDNKINDSIAYVTELQQLESYNNYDIIIYEPDYYDKIHNIWPRGMPISYKYGYECKVVNVSVFIIVTNNPQMYPLYNKI